jgi:DNA primase
VLAWLERQITEHGPQTGAALDAAMGDEAWATTARGWLKVVAADEEHGFDDLQRVLHRMWIDALGDDAQALAAGEPDAECLARLRALRERIAGLKALLTGQAA